MSLIIKADALPNMPWQDRPAGCSDPVWRFDGNPVIPRNLTATSNSIFNSAVVPFKGEFAGVFRCDDKARQMQIHAGFSKDGYKWTIDPEPIQWTADDPEILKSHYKYDPRVVWLEDRYYIMFCNGYAGPTIGVGYTKDFKSFHQIENALLPFNRNGVPFPRKVKGKYAMYSRPSDNGHTPFGDIYYSSSPDMIHWGCHRHTMRPAGGWESTKVGVGPIPIETNEGWLIFYHGVLTSCNGFVYSFGAALMDLDEPWKVISRGKYYLMSPQTIYECAGDVPNVCFPCAALVDGPSQRFAIYYGAADTVTGLAFGKVQDVLDFIRKHPR
jgi:beta-1,4-mannooligosaccharide/beta-1,4-mannosyl-N-acetylglucosamine phosphorylase